jgi:formylmethanofuran dehydrogenase subunit C
MPLILTLKTESSIPLEVDSVQLETARLQSADEVKSTLIQRGNKQVSVGEFFDVSGSASEDHELVWEGDCSRVKLIGTYLKSGRIRVEGNAGMHLGAEMTGGEIIVNGNAGDWVGAEMHGGRIHVHGNAGHLVGAVYRGGRRGMTGGEILIDGNAGNEIGHTMRRGLIAVGGQSGDAAGFNMIAGSVLLFGETGIRPGAGMRRGTIGLFGDADPPAMLPTFQFACTDRPVFLRFTLLQLRSRGFSVPADSLDAEFHRYNGDFLELGKGEIFIRAGR